MIEEIWKSINGTDYYKVSNLGNVFSVRSNRNIAFNIPKNPKYAYASVFLHTENGRFLKKVHTLVANAFIEKSQGRDYVNHKNLNKLDNRVENLEWCTIGENNAHFIRHLRRSGKTHYNAKISDSDVMFILQNSHLLTRRELVEAVGLKRDNGVIYQILTGGSFGHVGVDIGHDYSNVAIVMSTKRGRFVRHYPNIKRARVLLKELGENK